MICWDIHIRTSTKKLFLLLLKAISPEQNGLPKEQSEKQGEKEASELSRVRIRSWKTLRQSIRWRVLFINLLVSPSPLERTTVLEGERSVNIFCIFWARGNLILGSLFPRFVFKQADLAPPSKYFLLPLVSCRIKPGISFRDHVKMVLFLPGNCHEYQPTK